MVLQTIIYEKRDNVAWVTFNRPDALNAQNDTFRAELKDVLAEASGDELVRVIVLTGAGEKAFCAGADVNEFAEWTSNDVIKKFKGTKRHYDMLREMPQPVIAMVNGLAVGGGCELALACDIIVASEDARFGQLELRVGVIPGGGGTQVLPRLIGEKKAKELIFTSAMLSAQEAMTLGMINRVVPKKNLRAEVESLIKEIKTQSPAILRLAKLAVNKSLETSLSAGLSSELDYFALCFATEDQKEGAAAFLEKRKPDYTGK